MENYKYLILNKLNYLNIIKNYLFLIIMNNNIKVKDISNNILNIFNNIFSTLEDNPISDIVEIIQPNIIIKIIKEIEPEIEILTSSKFNETEFNESNINNELINILFIIERYIEINKDKEIIKDNLNLNKLNILKLSKKDEKNIEEYIKFCEMIICTCYLSDRKDFFIDYIGKLDEETVDFFINIIEKYFTFKNNEEINEYDINNDIYNYDDKNGNENNINGNIMTQSSITDDLDDKKNINRSLQFIRLNSIKNFRKINGSGNFSNKDNYNNYKEKIIDENNNISKTSILKLKNKRTSEDTLNELNFSYIDNSEKFDDENNKEQITNSNSSLLKIIDNKLTAVKSNIKFDNKNNKFLSSKNIIFSSNFENKKSEYGMKSKSSLVVPKIKEMFSENYQKDIIMTSGFKNIIRKSFLALNKGKIDFFLKNGLGEFMKDITNQINILENKLEEEIEKRMNFENTNEKLKKMIMKEKEKYNDLNLRFSLIKNENNKVELLKSDLDKEREEKEGIRKELGELILEIERKRIYYEKIEENYKRENKELQSEFDLIRNCIPEYKLIKKENETLKKNLTEINKKLISEDRKEMENRLLSMSKNIDKINKEKIRLSKRVQVFSKELMKKGETIKEMKKSIINYKKSFADIKRSIIFNSSKDIINNLKSDENIFQDSKQSRQKSTFLKKDSNVRDDFVITEENSIIMQTNNSQDVIKDENQEIDTKKENESNFNSESNSNNESSFDSLSNNEIRNNNEAYFSFDEINYNKKKTIQNFRKISSLNDNEDEINIGSQLNLMKLKSANQKAFIILPSKRTSKNTIFTDDYFDENTNSEMNIGSIFNKINELKNKTSRLNSINTVMSFVKAENFTINNIVDGILKIKERNLNSNTNPIKTSYDYEKNEINNLNEEIKDLKLKLKEEEIKNINISIENQIIINEKDKLNNQINEKLLEIDICKIELNRIKDEIKICRENYFQLEFDYNEYKKKSFESQNKLLNENFELNNKIESMLRYRERIIKSNEIITNFEIINQIDIFISGEYNHHKELESEISLLKKEIINENQRYQELEKKINIIDNSKLNLLILFQDEFEKIKYNHIIEVNKFKLINTNLLKNYNEIKKKIEEFEIDIKN